MKKHLIAAAVAGALAVPAMAQVEIYGKLGAAYTNVTNTLSEGGVSFTVDSVDTSTQGARAGHRLGLKGTEDLGGGMKAGFVYELGISGTQGSGLGANRLSYVDLSGGFGTFRFGKQDTNTRQIYNGFTAHGNSGFAPGNTGGSVKPMLGALVAVSNLDEDTATAAQVVNAIDKGCDGISDAADKAECSAFTGGFGFGQTRVDNAITYITPSFGGLSVQVQYATNDKDLSITTSSTSTDHLNYGVSYAAGPLAASLARDTSETGTEGTTTTTEFTRDMLGLSYDLGMAKAFFTYTNAKRVITGDDSLKLKDMTIGVSVPVSALTLVASYSDGDVKDTEPGSTKTDMNAYQLQANYALSKRTTLFAFYGETELKPTGSSYKLDGVALGIQHDF